MIGRYSVFKWQFWRWRYRYWRKRAVKAERALEAEKYRNLEREDTLVTVPMRIQGLWGMPARNAPASLAKQVSAPRQLTQATDPWDALSWADKQEFDMEWKQAAAAAGVSEQQARQQFLLELQNRRIPINDEPFGAN